MEETEKIPVVAEIPDGMILMDVKTPLGESVLVISEEELKLMKRDPQGLKGVKANPYVNQTYKNYCVLENNKVIASPDYPYEVICPVVINQFPSIKNDKKEESWK